MFALNYLLSKNTREKQITIKKLKCFCHHCYCWRGKTNVYLQWSFLMTNKIRILCDTIYSAHFAKIKSTALFLAPTQTVSVELKENLVNRWMLQMEKLVDDHAHISVRVTAAQIWHRSTSKSHKSPSCFLLKSD